MRAPSTGGGAQVAVAAVGEDDGHVVAGVGQRRREVRRDRGGGGGRVEAGGVDAGGGLGRGDHLPRQAGVPQVEAREGQGEYDHDEWCLDVTVDLSASAEAGEVVVRLGGVRRR